MSENVKKEPDIRFEGFVDDWEQRQLGKISDKVKEKNKTGEVKETLTNSAEYGIISQRDFFDKAISNSKNLESYYVVKNDDFVYNPRISNFAPVGPIKRNKLGRTGVMSPLYYVFRTKDVNKNFLEKYFDTNYWNHFMELNGDSGARSDRFAIKDSVFSEMPIPYPLIVEQEKIGQFFIVLDDTITLHQQKLELLKKTKKSYLQKMFPKSGETVPEIRFDGFRDEWEEKVLGYILEEKNIQHPQSKEYPLVSFTAEKGVTSKTERYDREQLVRGDKINKKYKATEMNDIVYNPANLKFGAIALNRYGKAVFSPIYITFVVNKSIAYPNYVEKFITRPDFIKYSLRYQQGTVYERQSVNPEALLSMKISLPSKEEQLKIGNLFDKLEGNIDLLLKKIESLKSLKKSLLQKMFI